MTKETMKTPCTTSCCTKKRIPSRKAWTLHLHLCDPVILSGLETTLNNQGHFMWLFCFFSPSSCSSLARGQQQGSNTAQEMEEDGIERIGFPHYKAVQEGHPIEDLCKGHSLLDGRILQFLEGLVYACRRERKDKKPLPSQTNWVSYLGHLIRVCDHNKKWLFGSLIDTEFVICLSHTGWKHKYI